MEGLYASGRRFFRITLMGAGSGSASASKRKLGSRIRIRNKVKGRIQIRVKEMRICNADILANGTWRRSMLYEDRCNRSRRHWYEKYDLWKQFGIRCLHRTFRDCYFYSGYFIFITRWPDPKCFFRKVFCVGPQKFIFPTDWYYPDPVHSTLTLALGDTVGRNVPVIFILEIVYKS